MEEFNRLPDFDEKELEEGLKLMESIIGGRWNPLILFELEEGAKTYTDIKNSIDYISDTELQRKLSALMDNKLVKKDSMNEARKGEYTLTPYGVDIAHTLRHIMDISVKHRTLA